MRYSTDIARKHYLQLHEEHFQKAVETEAEKLGTDGGLNNAATSSTQPQDGFKGNNLTSLNTVGCDHIKKDASLCETHLIVPRGFEPPVNTELHSSKVIFITLVITFIPCF